MLNLAERGEKVATVASFVKIKIDRSDMLARRRPRLCDHAVSSYVDAFVILVKQSTGRLLFLCNRKYKNVVIMVPWYYSIMSLSRV